MVYLSSFFYSGKTVLLDQLCEACAAPVFRYRSDADNWAAFQARVQAAGYEVFLGPKELLIPSEPPLSARIAFCRGPLGEEIEFFRER